MRQRLLTLRGIGLPQVAIQLSTRPGLIEGLGDVLQAGGGQCQQLGIRFAGRRLGMPQRFETRLQQTPVAQVMQGLQILPADLDIGAQWVSRTALLRQRITRRIQPIVGQ